MSPSLVELEALVLKVVNRPGGEVRLRRRVSALPDGEALSAAIAWERVEPATLAHQLVLTLDRRGPIPAALLQALAEERPSLLPRLRDLALDLGLAPPDEPPGQRSRLVPLARALTERLGADPRPYLDLVPQAPVADTWMDVLLDADASARGALLALCWPRPATPSRPALRQHLSCLLGASTLTSYEFLNLTQEAGIPLGAPRAERLDLFLDELLRPERTDERLHRLATLVAAALAPEEARALAIAELVERVVEEKERRELELDQALRLVYRALLRRFWDARRGEIPVEPTLDEALGIPSVAAEELEGSVCLDRERDLDDAEALTEALRFRVSPWDWLRATALVQRASRGGLNSEQQVRAAQLQARLRPRLRWLVTRGDVSARLALSLLGSTLPLYVWGLSSVVLTSLLSWLRVVAFSSTLVLCVMVWFQAILPDALPQEGEPGHEDPAALESASAIIAEILGDVPPGGVNSSQEPERWVKPISGVLLDNQGRVVVPQAASAPDPDSATGTDWISTASPDVPIAFVGLSGGHFLMGAPVGEERSDDDERPQHLVTVSPFAIGRSEVTQAQWAAVVTAAQAAKDPDAAGLKVDPSYFKGATLPVERVSWCDAARFANALSRLEDRQLAYTVGSDCESGGAVAWDRAADGYRLPTEAEWEYAARAGTTTAYATGDTEADLARAGWYDGSSGSKTHAVCTAEVKPWDLCDLHGNVWEWVWDWYDASYYGKSPVADPAGPADRGGHRVRRGGSWYVTPGLARSAGRHWGRPSVTSDDVGFRLVLPAAVPEPG